MALLPETRLIVDQVEQITERPIRFTEDAALPVIANLRIARNGADEHVLALQPGGESLDYECPPGKARNADAAHICRSGEKMPGFAAYLQLDQIAISAIIKAVTCPPPDMPQGPGGVIFCADFAWPKSIGAAEPYAR